jgi:hypothetical protein
MPVPRSDFRVPRLIAFRVPSWSGGAVRLDDFQALVDRLLKDMPPTYLDGVVAVEVSPKTVPHPVRGDVYTLGECIPLEWSGSGADLQSRIVLYHGSFAALAPLGGAGGGNFNWREEAWETLAHELRHHLEWRANTAALEAYDWAAEENFKRHEGQPFDPAFYRSGESVAEGIWKVDDDVFIERKVGRDDGEGLEIVWHGRLYRVPVRLPSMRAAAFLRLDGLADPPPGDAVLVLPRRTTVFDLFHKSPPPEQHAVSVKPVDA